MDEMRTEILQLADMADEMREPAFSGWRPVWTCMLNALNGRYEEAEALALQALPIAQRTQHPNYLGSVSALFYDIRRGQGRLGELEPIVLQLHRENPGVHSWKAALAYLYSDIDRSAEAREWFDDLASQDFTDVPRDFLYMTVVVLASDVARRLDDKERAARLYEMLLPFAAHNVVVGNAILCLGSASRWLGQLAATTGRWDDAVRHFEYALTFDEKIGARPWLGRTQYEYATMLRDRDAPGDRVHAVDFVAKATAIFDELGMKADLERALALKLELQGARSSGIYTSIDNVARAVERERPQISVHPAPDGTVTLMFSDIEDSTVLTESLGDVAWQELLRRHNALIREQIRAHGGFEVKTMGDGFMVAFQSAKKGLDCAISIQVAFAEHNAADGEHVKVRIGLHAGEAIKEGDDFYGKNVIMASRVAGKANGGEILVSSLLRSLVESSVDTGLFDEAREVELKGLSGLHTVHRVRWEA
jgi:class 3 adenylate cyclase